MTSREPRREAWQSLKARIGSLPGMTRGALARHWTTAAQLEHASVGSFSRFSLQLLAVGAPPSLIERTHAAALDEIKHAELCFSLATLYSGRPIGPGPLPVDAHSFGAWDLPSVAVATVEEGCVGETIAAIEAETACALAEDEAVRCILARIYEDEARHAELAFGFVRWAAETGGASVRTALAAAFERTLARHRAELAQASVVDSELEAHGVLSAPRKRELRARIASEVIEPAAASLCGLV